MRRSFAGFALLAVIGAAVAAILLSWLPARHSHRDAAWAAAGQRALAEVVLPPAYAPVQNTGAVRVCSNGGQTRCFVGGTGDPQLQIPALTAAFAPVATGTVDATCQPVPLPASPQTCHLAVPVAGSRLLVEVFAKPVDDSLPLAKRTYDGTYVEIHLDRP
jgi:hypothetical protein